MVAIHFHSIRNGRFFELSVTLLHSICKSISHCDKLYLRVCCQRLSRRPRPTTPAAHKTDTQNGAS